MWQKTKVVNGRSKHEIRRSGLVAAIREYSSKIFLWSVDTHDTELAHGKTSTLLTLKGRRSKVYGRAKHRNK